MKEESKLYFRDAAGRFEAVKEEAYDICRNEFDLTIYSLTWAGGKVPVRLIVKMTPIGKPDCYFSGRTGVVMCTLNYLTFPVEGLKKICSYMKTTLSSMLLLEREIFEFKEGNDLFRGFGHGNELLLAKPISLEAFFRINPCEDDPGAQIYLRDKAFFLSRLADSRNPDFAAMPFLTDEQKANVASIDLSHADVSGRRVLSRMFKGYKSLCRLDLSAFDTTGATEMEEMFFQCQSLRQLDMSAFDFSQVRHLNNIFGQCRALEEVILSDTILQAGRIPHFTGRNVEAVRHNYRMSGPYPNELDCTTEPEKVFVSFSEAAEEEIREHLGLRRDVKLTIVPHRACKKKQRLNPRRKRLRRWLKPHPACLLPVNRNSRAMQSAVGCFSASFLPLCCLSRSLRCISGVYFRERRRSVILLYCRDILPKERHRG